MTLTYFRDPLNVSRLIDGYTCQMSKCSGHQKYNSGSMSIFFLQMEGIATTAVLLTRTYPSEMSNLSPSFIRIFIWEGIRHCRRLSRCKRAVPNPGQFPWCHAQFKLLMTKKTHPFSRSCCILRSYWLYLRTSSSTFPTNMLFQLGSSEINFQQHGKPQSMGPASTTEY